MSFLVLEDDELDFFWNSVQDIQVIFHSTYAPEGMFNYQELSNLKNKKDVIVFLDRNLLSGLLKLCEQGNLTDEKEKNIIAKVMLWTLGNNFSVSAGLAIKENATKTNNSEYAKKELQRFKEIIEYYPTMTWLRLAEGAINSIPICPFSNKSFDTTIEYHEQDDHFLMNMACMLYVIYLWRRKDLSQEDKIMEFLKWNFDYLLISQYINVYIVLLFSHQEGIRPPKNSDSLDMEKIYNGCYNQAWDLTYLSIWSTFYWDESKSKEVFFFATADQMLKSIFINTHGGGNLFSLIQAVFPKKSAQRLIDFYETNTTNRVKPNFGSNPKEYFYSLIEQEKQRLIKC
jgi:hypothetical protein